MSLKTSSLPFKTLIDRQVHDQIMQKAVANAQETIGRNRQKMVDELGHWEDWRDRAQTKEEASQYILNIAKEKKAKKIVKAKSMVTEEIGLNPVLENAGINVIETDLAEFILQQAKDAPSHVVVPAIHKNRAQIRQIFHDKLGYNGSDTPEEMTRFVRQNIRDDFFTADIGITGCNFAVAETGSVCLVTNEGNARLSTTLPKTHIAVMGMERIAPTFKEVDILITMLARSAVGLRLTGYNTWLTGPKENDNVDGPEDFHLVIVDNGRSKIIGSEFKDILRCIRCGACMNTCPAYRHIGGQGYDSIYPGPVGAVLTPLLGGYKDFKNLPYVCSLCTACDSVCPVKIPLSNLIKKHREVMVEQGITPTTERNITRVFNYVNRHPMLWKVGMNMGAHATKWFIKEGKAPLNIGAIKAWTEARNLPEGDGESFRSWFKKHQKEEK